MRRRLKNKLVLGAVGVAALAATGGTYAATKPSEKQERQAFLKSAAERLDVSSTKLEDALEGAQADRLDAAVKAGRITKAQADDLKKRTAEGGLPFLGGPRHHGRHGPGGPGHGGHKAAAKYLGLSDSALRKQIISGRSLADVAKARGKSLDGLKDAMKKAITAKLDKGVKDERLTEAQRKEMLADLDERVDEMVARKGGRFGPGGGGGPGGPGDHGPGPSGSGDHGLGPGGPGGAGF